MFHFRKYERNHDFIFTILKTGMVFSGLINTFYTCFVLVLSLQCLLICLYTTCITPCYFLASGDLSSVDNLYKEFEPRSRPTFQIQIV